MKITSEEARRIFSRCGMPESAIEYLFRIVNIEEVDPHVLIAALRESCVINARCAEVLEAKLQDEGGEVW